MARNGQVIWDWCFVCWNLCKTCEPNRGCFRAALSQHGKGPMCTLHITPYCPSLEMFRTTVNHPFQRTIKLSWSSKRALIYSIQVFISTFWCSIQRGGATCFMFFAVPGRLVIDVALPQTPVSGHLSFLAHLASGRVWCISCICWWYGLMVQKSRGQPPGMYKTL